MTSRINADAMKASGLMIGSKTESGHVFAWRRKPNKYAIGNSGARYMNNAVIISFKTNATFEPDYGITNPHVQQYNPVTTVFPGPIYVWDVQIVEVIK